MRSRLVLTLSVVMLLGAGCVPDLMAPAGISESEAPVPETRRVEFAESNPNFRFTADVPFGWTEAYLGANESFYFTDGTRDDAKIFIRYFIASDFLTLPSVTVHSRTAKKIGEHDAVLYDIEKKPDITDFPNQPAWRNRRHRVLDIRLADGHGPFYVFAQNPEFPDAEFEKFIASVKFHNDKTAWVEPMDRAKERVTKKQFGIKVSPENSPVSPERFSGYHTGTDFEVLDKELEAEVEVRAVCGGPFKYKQRLGGYGGVVLQDCMVGDETVSIIYGHLKLEGVIAKRDAYLVPGKRIGVLGASYSTETDGERKHLHLGIRKTKTTDMFRGYVSRESDLKNWINPADLLF